MNKFICIFEFGQQLFTDERSAYQAREIIEGIMEETFRDCKDLLELRMLMDKQQRYLEQMIALSLIGYVAGRSSTRCGVWKAERGANPSGLTETTGGGPRPASQVVTLFGAVGAAQIEAEAIPKRVCKGLRSRLGHLMD